MKFLSCLLNFVLWGFGSLTVAYQLPWKIEDEPWTSKYGKQVDLPFSGPLSYSHLPQHKCLEDASEHFDIAILGFPFDTTVSYRTGARFGPYAIRSGSRRQRSTRGYTLSWNMNPYTQEQKIVDCGDVCNPIFSRRVTF